MSNRIPHVDYLVLDGDPHLVAHECETCGARYFDRRNACAGCFGTNFHRVDVPTTGEVRTFTKANGNEDILAWVEGQLRSLTDQ